jgi:hypothetical protein
VIRRGPQHREPLRRCLARGALAISQACSLLLAAAPARTAILTPHAATLTPHTVHAGPARPLSYEGRGDRQQAAQSFDDVVRISLDLRGREAGEPNAREFERALSVRIGMLTTLMDVAVHFDRESMFGAKEVYDEAS